MSCVFKFSRASEMDQQPSSLDASFFVFVFPPRHRNCIVNAVLKNKISTARNESNATQGKTRQDILAAMDLQVCTSWFKLKMEFISPTFFFCLTVCDHRLSISSG